MGRPLSGERRKQIITLSIDPDVWSNFKEVVEKKQPDGDTSASSHAETLFKKEIERLTGKDVPDAVDRGALERKLLALQKRLKVEIIKATKKLEDVIKQQYLSTALSSSNPIQTDQEAKQKNQECEKTRVKQPDLYTRHQEEIAEYKRKLRAGEENLTPPSFMSATEETIRAFEQRQRRIGKLLIEKAAAMGVPVNFDEEVEIEEQQVEEEEDEDTYNG